MSFVGALDEDSALTADGAALPADGAEEDEADGCCRAVVGLGGHKV